jgi:hypothetical protein
LHFSLILAVSFRDLLGDLGRGGTLFPHSLDQVWHSSEEFVCDALGMSLPGKNPFHATIATYLHSAGIEGGYGFFAPSVPNSAKLVFELHYEDGHVEYDLPRIESAASGARFIGLLDNIGQIDYEPLRQTMLKMLAYSAWRDHPGAISVRTVYGYIDEPGRVEAGQGKKESYHVSYVYDFTFPRASGD